MGIRVTPEDNAIGGYKLLWRGANNDDYFAQPLTDKIKANTYYKIYVKQIEGANANSEFSFGLGSTENGLEYASQNIRLGTNQGNNTIKSITIQTPSEVASTVYFTVKNTWNTCSSGTDPLTHIDYIALVEGIIQETSITGVTSATYLADKAYAPEIEGAIFDMTNLITNPGFETNSGDRSQSFPGWTKTGSTNTEYCIRTNLSGTAIAEYGDGTAYLQYWVGSTSTVPDISVTQTLTDLPNGTYRITAAGTFGGNGFYLVANEKQQEITTAQIYTVETIVTNGTLTLGVKTENTNSNFILADNFHLYYLGYDASAAIEALSPQIETAQSLLESSMSASAKTALNDAITTAQGLTAENTEAEINAAAEALSSATTQANQSIAEYIEIKQTIDKAILYKTAITVEDIDAINSLEQTITDAETGYNDGSLTFDAIATLETAMLNYMKAQAATLENPANYNLLLTNPSFEEGDGWNNGWEIDRNTTGNADFRLIEGQNPTDGAKIFNAWAPQINYINLTQTINLPAGVYTFSGDIRSDRENTTVEGTRLVAITNEQTYQSELMEFLYPEDWQATENWDHLSITFSVSSEQEVTLGIYSKGQNISNNTEGFFQADNMQLSYLGESIITSENNHVTAFGAIEATELNEHLTTEVTSVDIREASINNPGDIKPQNPNTIIYGLPAGNEREVELQENYAFNAPEEINVPLISYTRVAFSNNEDSKVNNETLRGWQTICLPFDVTSIYAISEYNISVPLAPIMSPIFDNGVDDSNVYYSHPFWLYAIDADGQLSPAAEIKANVPYLMLIPNDPDYYAEFYNIAGNITFSGEAIAATALTEQEGTQADYNLIGYFDGAAETLPTVEGKTYYALDAEGANFVHTDFAPIASFRAFATLNATSQSAPQLLSIFGDGDGTLTALPTIKEALGDRAQSVTVYTAKGGIRIESAKDCTVNVYSIDGALLQTVTVSAGGNEFVALPAGKYIANGSVVIAQ